MGDLRAMAPPSILLREFHTEGISDLIPGKLAQTYQVITFTLFEQHALSEISSNSNN
jgi:hypothetical protein